MRIVLRFRNNYLSLSYYEDFFIKFYYWLLRNYGSTKSGIILVIIRCFCQLSASLLALFSMFLNLEIQCVDVAITCKITIFHKSSNPNTLSILVSRSSCLESMCRKKQTGFNPLYRLHYLNILFKCKRKWVEPGFNLGSLNLG